MISNKTLVAFNVRYVNNVVLSILFQWKVTVTIDGCIAKSIGDNWLCIFLREVRDISINIFSSEISNFDRLYVLRTRFDAFIPLPWPKYRNSMVLKDSVFRQFLAYIDQIDQYVTMSNGVRVGYELLNLDVRNCIFNSSEGSFISSSFSAKTNFTDCIFVNARRSYVPHYFGLGGEHIYTNCSFRNFAQGTIIF